MPRDDDMRVTLVIFAAMAILFSAMVLVPGEAEADPGKSENVMSSGSPGNGPPGAIMIDTTSETYKVFLYWDFSSGEDGPPNILIKLPDGRIVLAGALAH
jgi:hypothetical protein